MKYPICECGNKKFFIITVPYLDPKLYRTESFLYPNRATADLTCLECHNRFEIFQDEFDLSGIMETVKILANYDSNKLMDHDYFEAVKEIECI